eukprot:CAMPEP_0201675206 /NCGR_PEP_ID=MMETSP0494-20130426/39085_1 /ASSEMBLY_ACC=CAM_ASM_000839 /TAXON_ID=420259 /ORGANISM="Thalassiosira gravida, Strain GMp14c1" /LENGTH=142 /DNA_ID=CAMNT_0048157585 /DNA_START=18 /DNA_END=443 /DNA_ORIENTATION=+
MIQTVGIPNDDDQEHRILSNNDDGEEEEEYNYRNFQRVTSRVQSNEDGSAEAILAAVTPMSITQNSTSSGSTNLSNSLPLIRTKSTPNTTQITNVAIGGGGGGNTMIRGGNSIKSPSRKMAYALRKVFSREEKDDWREGEAE